ncbi:MAG: hypothetical protein CL675_00975 [Bdellovibrionaceae bacterium]|nr:hypothetical protein [Pseudobdellovibrionaceae bacterium]|tara:strand:+ start:337 stop:726 length:390 start_codon:yes stop_codon:yes gene_type:complete
MATRLNIFAIAVFVCMTAFGPVSQAQSISSTPSTKQQLSTIIFAGLGGGVLGLSTLSFYGRPQDRLENIGVGFAIGIIIGVSYTTYQAATRSYVDAPPVEPELQLAGESRFQQAISQQDALKLGWNWSF